MTSDNLTVRFDNNSHDESGICISRVVNGKIVVLKMELGEQANILYRLLTEQMAKAKIKVESMDKLHELKAEVAGIKKIIDYCQKWQKKIEHQLEDDIWSENAEEDLGIINEMLTFCHKRLDEMNDELNDIRGLLSSRYNHGDYTDTAKRRMEERINKDFDEGGE